jgi:hypothetical protein
LYVNMDLLSCTQYYLLDISLDVYPYF